MENVTPAVARARQNMFFAVRKPAVAYSGELPSELSHWPIQLHLINPAGGHFRESNLVIAADCTAFTHGNFHGKYLKGQTLVIACPKLDQGLDIYKEKIRQLIDIAKVNTITVIIMEVACCRGLLQVVRNAASEASRNVPVKLVIVSIKGEAALVFPFNFGNNCHIYHLDAWSDRHR